MDASPRRSSRATVTSLRMPDSTPVANVFVPSVENCDGTIMLRISSAGGPGVRSPPAPDLMEATKQAVRATMEHLGDSHGLSREEAYALCSVAVDLRIHEVVDAPNWVVGAFLPDDIFTGGGNG